MAKRRKRKRTTEEYILNVLRHGTLRWEGRNAALRKCRKEVMEGSRSKFYYQCAQCKEWDREASHFEVDHIKEIGGFKGDWNDIISRAYDENNLQVLCVVCHAKKTLLFTNASALYRRKSK